jgi:hypothetical protein
MVRVEQRNQKEKRKVGHVVIFYLFQHFTIINCNKKKLNVNLLKLRSAMSF